MVIISVKNMITMVVVYEKELNDVHQRLADEQASYWQSLTRELAGGTREGGFDICKSLSRYFISFNSLQNSLEVGVQRVMICFI